VGILPVFVPVLGEFAPSEGGGDNGAAGTEGVVFAEVGFAKGGDFGLEFFDALHR
jgi:hypothetical protein